MQLHIVQLPLLQVFKDLCYTTERDYGTACQGIYNAAISCAYWDILAKKCMTNGSRSSPGSEDGLWLVQVKVRGKQGSAGLSTCFKLIQALKLRKSTQKDAFVPAAGHQGLLESAGVCMRAMPWVPPWVQGSLKPNNCYCSLQVPYSPCFNPSIPPQIGSHLS